LPPRPAPAFSGHLALRAAVRDHGRTVLAAQSFRAPFHVGKSYWDPDAATLVVQVVNPTAGILAGDRLESHIAVDPGAALLVTTPSASRVFTMRDGDAASVQTFSVADRGWLEVLPEPLVPHRGSRFHQRTVVDVAPAGGLFFVDQLVAGRIGHGEAWSWERLQLDLTVRIAGELVLRERFDQSGAGLRDLAALAGTGDTTCFANAILLAPAVADTAEPAWRSALSELHRDGVWLGVSALRRGGWSLKIVAPDTIRLRDTLRAARAVLAAQFPRLRAETRKL